jgi:hypothetical protein
LSKTGKENPHVGFEVLTAVVMKSTIFWDITPCSPLSANRRFGGIRVEERAKQETSMKQIASRGCFTLVSCMAHSSTLKMEATCSSEISGLHGVISQKIVLFKNLNF